MRTVLLPCLLVVGGLFAYHLLVAEQPAAGDVDAQLQALVGRVRALEGDGSGGGLSTPSLQHRLGRMEARIDALAARVGTAAPNEAGGGGPAPGEPGYVWDERALEWLEAALAEARARSLRKRQAEQYRSLIRRIAADVSAERQEEIVTLVMDYHGDAATIYEGGSAGSTKEEREEAARRLLARRADLERSLRALVSDALTESIMRTIPAPAPVDGQRAKGSDK